MYLSSLTIENFRCFGEGASKFQVSLKSGLTALVGANDAGKTAIVDAIRLALGTSDQDRMRIEDSDFHGSAKEIRVTCKFESLSDVELRAFVEYLTYGEKPDDKPALFVNWSAENTGELRRGRPYRRVEVWSGKEANGTQFSQDARLLLQATYLRPLRDAEEALSAGRGSRLAQVLHQSKEIRQGSEAYDPNVPLKDQKLNVIGITNLLNELLGGQQGVGETRGKINKTLEQIALHGEQLKGAIRVSGADAPTDTRLRELLEKLDLRLDGLGRAGLGSDNLLFMACEFLLVSQEEVGNKLLLIEEPEAHLHPQRQLQVMKALQEQAKSRGIQVIVTTHSPLLSSAIDVENLIVISNRRGFSLESGQTQLEASDYRFLQRFLDATKANLFFARGVIIVEGDAENILLPTIALLIGRDLTEHGVSIVNVGGVGLRRYARILQRKNAVKEGEIGVRVACVTDLDIMPNCAPVILKKVQPGVALPALADRRWLVRADLVAPDSVAARTAAKCASTDGQSVKTFVSAEWTLEYDLALGPRSADGALSGGLAQELTKAAVLAYRDDNLCSNKQTRAQVEAEAVAEWAKINAHGAADGCSVEEVKACHIYSWFTGSGAVSKAVAAQYLAEILVAAYGNAGGDAALRAKLPKYLVDAIEHVTSVAGPVGGAGDDA